MASVSAKPSHMRPSSEPRSSGWRPTDSMVLPKMKPTPTPGPIAPKPVARPSWSALAASSMLPSSAMQVSLVVGVDRSTDVDGGQGGEDVRLQERDQGHLERVDGRRHGHSEREEEVADDPAEERAQPEEHRDHEVAGE